MSDPADGAHCPMPDRSRDDQVRAWLGQPRVVAVVGMSPKSSRPSNEVGLYLAEVGFTAIPVHPRAAEIGGLRAYPDLASIPTPPPVEIVDLFVSGERTLAVVEQAAVIGAKLVWFQPGAEFPPAEARARELGIEVISGICTMAEHRRLALG